MCAGRFVYWSLAYYSHIDELEAMIIVARAERPTATNNRTSGVDGHNLIFRYLWQVSNEGKPLVNGMDVTTLNNLRAQYT
jgi:hypothetical protein